MADILSPETAIGYVRDYHGREGRTVNVVDVVDHGERVSVFAQVLATDGRKPIGAAWEVWLESGELYGEW